MSVTTFILSVIIADKISPASMPGRWAGSLVAGFIGNWIGPLIFGTWGPMVVGFSLVLVPLLLLLLQASWPGFLNNILLKRCEQCM